MANGQELAQQNIDKFLAWVKERKDCNDWEGYIYGDKLNRRIVAVECNFSKSVLKQNPAVKEALIQLEMELEEQGVFTFKAPSSLTSNKSLEKESKLKTDKLDKRFKELEEKYILIKAENEHLRVKLKQYAFIEENMLKSGLLPSL